MSKTQSSHPQYLLGSPAARFYLNEVPLDRLFRVLDSLTMLGYDVLDQCLKAYTGQDGEYYPWEALLIENLPKEPLYAENPVRVDVWKILEAGALSEDLLVLTTDDDMWNAEKARRQAQVLISTYLSTTDARNMFTAVSSTWSYVLDSSMFWASRFKPVNAELTWLYEIRHDRHQGPRDWKRLFQLLTESDRNDASDGTVSS